MINKDAERKIKVYAKASYPDEVCGFVVKGDFIPVPNIHKNPHKAFTVPDDMWREFANVCTVFIHSHPDWYPVPSEADMRQQEATAIPWGIVGTDGERVSDIQLFGDQVPKPSFEERTFCHGVTDCYDVIRDWYKQERDIELKNVPRGWEWWKKGEDLYTENFQQVGFKKVPMDQIMDEGPKVGDVFFANVGSNKFNHGGVYVGSGLGLHHLTANKPIDTTRLCAREPIQRWMKFINMWVRYET